MSASTFSSLCIPGKFCAHGFKQKDDILITIQAATNGWAAIGTGSLMDGSDMYVVTQINNKCTVSRRKGSGHSTPAPASSQIAKIVDQIPKEAAPEKAESWVKLQCTFSRPITSDTTIASSSAPYIWGMGPLSGENIQMHGSSDYGKANANFLEAGQIAGQIAGGSTSSPPSVDSSPDNTFSSLCIPGKFCAYGFKQKDDILITIQAATNGWAAIGTGSLMDASDMYVVTQINNKCTVSRRKGSGHSTPAPASSQIAKIVDQIPKEAAPAKAESWVKLQCTFSRPITSDTTIASSSVPYIWGMGPLSGENIQMHGSSDYGKANANFLEAGQIAGGSTSTPPFVDSSPDNYNLVLFAHGILFFLAWAVAPFMGIFIARYLKDLLGVWWYKLHLYIMLGVTGGFSLISTILIVLYKQGGHIKTNHEIIGVAIFFLLVLQIILGFVSNHLWSPDRTSIPWWDKAHWWFGRLVVIVGITNVFLGILEFHEHLGIKNHDSLYITFGVIIGLGVISMIIGQFTFGQIHHLKEQSQNDYDDYDDYGKK